MSGSTRALLLCIGFFFFIGESIGQAVTVNSITILGLKRTKSSIIHRELTFAEGDTLVQMDLGPTMERNQNNLLNLGLFNHVRVNVSEWDTDRHRIDVLVEVRESWYVYVLPILELADRNFNVWWTTYNGDLDRLNLGINLDMLNFSGRNDKFKANLQFGYTPKQSIEYRFPYFNRRQSLGLIVGASHRVNKEISYATVNNQEQFIRLEDRKLLERWSGDIGLFYRPNIFLKYDLSFEYQHHRVDEAIPAEYNLKYFRKNKTTHETLITQLSAEYDGRDVKIYAARGIRTQLKLEKTGFGEKDDENNFLSYGAIEFNIATGRRFQHRFTGIGQYSLSRRQPSYLFYQGLGYSQNYLRGYELYVVDGLDVAIGKYHFAYKLVDTKVKLGRMMPLPQFKEMAFHVYLSLFVETGYVNDPFTADINPMANRWLYGGGPGVDFLLYHNFLFQFNVSTNHLNEWGLFIHNRTSF